MIRGEMIGSVEAGCDCGCCGVYLISGVLTFDITKVPFQFHPFSCSQRFGPVSPVSDEIQIFILNSFRVLSLGNSNTSVRTSSGS